MPSKRTPAESPVETEAKIPVASFTVVRRRIENQGGRLTKARTHETNALFDSADRSVTSSGRSLRVRTYGLDGSLTLKGVARVEGGIKSRMELESAVQSPEKLTQILVSLGFMPQFRYEKFREVWKLGRSVICLDETPIGRYVEIEGTASEIHRVAGLLSLSPKTFTSASYPALWFASGRLGDMVFPRRKRSMAAMGATTKRLKERV